MSCAAFKLRFGIIGTNFISDWLLEGAAEDSRFEVAAIYSRSQDTANAFAVKHNIPYTFVSLDAMGFIAFDRCCLYCIAYGIAF